jgi:iron-sulfur cluster repair protein YtfE (RIC family)
MEEYLLAQVKRVAQTDHEIIFSAGEHVKRMAKEVYSTTTAQDFANFKRFITDRIVRHFTYEEDQLFPALLSDNPTTKMLQIIAELSQEHTLLLKRMQLLGVQVGQSPPVNSTGQPWTEMTGFFKDLEEHAVKEEQLLESPLK